MNVTDEKDFRNE